MSSSECCPEDTPTPTPTPTTYVGGRVEYTADFLTREKVREVRRFLEGLRVVDDPEKIVAGVPCLLHRPPITAFGKKCRQHRDVGFFGPPSVAGYRYSQQEATRQDLPPVVSELMAGVNEKLGTALNSALINCYPPGDSSISAHQDNESGLRRSAPVAAISIGATRTFRLKEKPGGARLADIPLESGSLVVMRSQRGYTHEIPTQRRVVGTRWSITFREHLPGGAD